MTRSAALIITAKTGRLTLTSASFIARLPAGGAAARRGRPGRHRRAAAPAAARRRRFRRRGAAAAAAGAALRLARLQHPHRDARRQLVQPARRQHLVALQAVGDFPEVALPDAQRDALLRDRAVLDDVDRRHAGQHRHRGVRHGHDVVVELRQDDALREEPRLEQAFLVVDQGFHGERAHRLIERRADVGDLAVEHAVAERLDAELHRLARRHDAGVPFLDARAQLQRVHLDDGRHLGAGGDVLADLHWPFRHDAGDGRLHDRVVRAPSPPGRTPPGDPAGCALVACTESRAAS